MKTFDSFSKKLKSFICSTNCNDKIALIHDTDVDGLCSSVILDNSLKELIGRRVDYAYGAVRGNPPVNNKIISNLKQRNVKLLFVTDISVDSYAHYMSKISRFAKIIIFDHHKLYKDINSKRIILIKPQLFQNKIEPSQYCTSKLVYDFFNAHLDIAYLRWFAAVGILGDSSYKSWRSFVNETLKQLHLKQSSDIYRSSLGRACSMINAARLYNPSAIGRFFNFLRKCDTHTHLLRSDWKKVLAVNKEVSYYFNRAKRCIEKESGVLFYHIKPKYAVGSNISTLLSFKVYPHNTVIILSDLGDDNIYVSARRQDGKVPVNDLLMFASKEVGGVGGGHKQAAGATIPKIQLANFKKEIVRLHIKYQT